MASTGLIDKTIPGLYNGVSQQSKEFIRDTQCLAQENAYGTIIGGLRKRPPLQFVQVDVDAVGDLEGAFYHTYDRGRIGTSTTQEAYITTVTANGTMRVWNASGVEQTVKMYTDSDKTALVSVHPYLTRTAGQITDGIIPSHLFRATTVADGTFVVNTSKTIDYDTTVGTSGRSQGTAHNYWTYWVKKTFFISTNQGFDYTVDGNTENSDKSSTVVTDLQTALGADWTAENPFLVHNADTTSTFSGTDSSGGSASSSWLKEVTSITQLPAASVPTVPVGYDPVIRIQGIDKGDKSYYYVKRDGEAWRETVGFDDELTSPNDGLMYRIDNTTLPHVLKKEGSEFHLYPTTPGDRIVGDDDIAPAPSFIGNSISDIFMFNDRLGLVSGDSVVLSETSNYTNFWATTTRSFPDTDPIDLKIDSTQVLYIDYAISYAKQLMLFTKEGQYVLSGQDGLITPNTVAINRVTSYPFSSTASPLSIGDKVLFSSSLGDFTNIYEYNTKGLGSTYEGSLITDHVPSYISGKVHKLVGLPSVGCVFLLPDTHAKELYVYNYYLDSKGQKAQSAWSKWTFNGDIIDIFTLDSYLYVSKFKEGTGTTKVMNRIDLSLVGDPLTIDYRDEIDSGEFLDYEFYYKFKKWHLDATESGIDNRRGRLIMRTLQFNYNEGSEFTVDLTRGSTSNTLGASELRDGKVIVGSKSDAVDIELFNNTSEGLQLNTVSFEGTYYSRSRNIKGR